MWSVLGVCDIVYSGKFSAFWYNLQEKRRAFARLLNTMAKARMRLGANPERADFAANGEHIAGGDRSHDGDSHHNRRHDSAAFGA